MTDSTSSSREMQTERIPRQRLRAFLWLAGVVLLVISIAPMYWVAIRWRASQHIEEEIARIRAAGEPTTFEEVIQAIPPLAPEKDCTALYQAVFAEITSEEYNNRSKSIPYVGDTDEPIPPPGFEWPGFAAAAEFIDGHQHTIAKLDEGAVLGGECRFPVTAAELAEGDLSPHWLSCRDAKSFLLVRADVAAHQGDAQEVCNALLSTYALSECMSADVHPTSLATRWSLIYGTNVSLAGMVGVVSFTDAQLAALQHSVRKIDFAKQLRSEMLFDRVFLMEAFENPYAWWWSGNPHDVEAYLDIARRNRDASRSSDVFEAAAKIEKNKDEVVASLGGEKLGSGNFEFTRLEGWGAGNNVGFAVQAEVRNCVLDTLLACERYRLAHGQFPDTIDVLIPELLPKSSKAARFHDQLHIRQDDGGLEVYAAGSFGSDATSILKGKSQDVVEVTYRTNTWMREFEKHLAEQAKQSKDERDETEPIE